MAPDLQPLKQYLWNYPSQTPNVIYFWNPWVQTKVCRWKRLIRLVTASQAKVKYNPLRRLAFCLPPQATEHTSKAVIFRKGRARAISRRYKDCPMSLANLGGPICSNVFMSYINQPWHCIAWCFFLALYLLIVVLVNCHTFLEVMCNWWLQSANQPILLIRLRAFHQHP